MTDCWYPSLVPPRRLAQDILDLPVADRPDRLAAVPEHMRSMVCAHVERAEMISAAAQGRSS